MGALRILLATVLGGSLAAGGPPAAAGRPPGQPPETLGLEQLLRDIRASNPEIRAADARYRAMLQRPIQEGTLPDPRIGAKYHNESFDRLTLGESEFTYYEFSVEQEVPFPGKLGIRETIAEREAARERSMRDATTVMVLARGASVYLDLAVVDRSARLLRESREALEAIAAQAATSYAVGVAAQQDVLRATQERTGIDARLTLVAQKRVAAESALNALLNRPPETPVAEAAWPIPVPALEAFDVLRTRLSAQAPELRAAREEVLRAEAGVELARRDYYPDFAVMGSYMNKSRLLPEWEVGVSVTVPLYFWRRQRPALVEADLNRASAEHSERSVRVSLEARLRELHAMADASRRVVELYGGRLIPQAELTLSSARASYGVGKVDFMTVLNAFLALLEYRMREAEELGTLGRARAEIASLVGETPLGVPLGDGP
jgi:outer membrane protein TolC